MKKTKKSRVTRSFVGEVDIDACELCCAPWNPRTAAELAAENPEMKKLVASVAARGVLQPIVIWKRDRDSDPAYVIAGCRRFTAAGLAGLVTIPAVVYEGLTEAEAREVTRIENEVRFGVSPLKDAELIAAMVEKYGYSVDEAAAHFGVSAATIRRRAKLADLAPEVRAVVETGNFTADTLERIALYTPEIQRSCLKSLEKMAKSSVRDGDIIRWPTIRWYFESASKDLDGVAFDTADCLACPKRTGALADLWGDVRDGSLGRCLDCDCFQERRNAAIREKARKIAADGAGRATFEFLDAEEEDLPEWRARQLLPDGVFGETRSAARPAAWYWIQPYSNEVVVFWGPRLADWQKRLADEKKAEELKAARSDADRKKAEERAAKESALSEAVGSAFEIHFEKALDTLTPWGERRCDWNAYAAKVAPAVFKGATTAKARAAIVALALGGIWRLYADECDTAELVPLLGDAPSLAAALGIRKDDVAAYMEAQRALDEFKGKDA